MTHQMMNGVSNPSVPDYGRLVEGPSQNQVSVRVEVQRDQLPLMALQS
jgi:hypothetical protein